MGTTRDYSILMTVRADLQNALGQIKGLDSSLHSLKNTGLELAGALGVGFSIAGIVDFVKTTLEADQQLGNLAKTLGLTTEQLSALQQEAKKAGVDIDAVQTALVALSRGATGQNAEGAKALQAMGISAKDAQGNIKPLAQLLQEVSSKFAGYQEGTEKAALATAVFGRAGAPLIPLLDKIGNEGLANITQKAIDAGTAVRGSAVDAANKFSDALAKLQDKLHGAVNQGLEQFTPQIKDLAKDVADPHFQKALSDTAQAILTIGKGAVEATGQLAEFLKWLGETAAASQVGPFDPVRIDARINEINDQIKKLQSVNESPVTSRLTEFLQDFAKGPNAGAIGATSDEVTKSTSAIKEEIAQLEKEKVILEKRRKLLQDQKGNADTDRQQAIDSAAGDFISGILDSKGRAPGTGGEDKAKAMAAALQKLQDQLASLRTQGLDPTATAWAQYNKTVDEAVAEAKKAGNTPAANTALNAVAVEAARVRDAALDDVAKKDQDAWNTLLGTLGTPVQVHIEDALTKIAKLNELMIRAPKSAEEFQQALQNIGQGLGVELKLPEYQGVDATVAGPHGELQKNLAAEKALNEAYQTDLLALKDKFRGTDQEHQQVYQAALADLDARYAKEREAIEQSRQQLILTTSANLFGQLATLSSSHNKKVATIGKAAAITQAIITTYQSAVIAYKDGLEVGGVAGPIVGAAFAAVAVAAGLANIAAIRAQPIGGYSEGGYTGAGGKYQPAGIVHKGEGVLSQSDIAALGGPAGFESLRAAIHTGYADGGYVHPLANAPTPAELGFVTRRAPRANMDSVTRADGGRSRVVPKVLVYFDRDGLMQELAQTKGFEDATVHVVSNHPNTIKAGWGL